MKRRRAAELMDRPGADPALLAQSLRDLAWANRYLGGNATLLHQLGRLLEGYKRDCLRFLDVGAGGGDMVRAVGRWCERGGLSSFGVALDFTAETARIAAANLRSWGLDQRLRVVRGDGLQLPFDDGAFDVSFCSTFLHHLDEEGAVRALGEMARVSEWGILGSDLRRGLGGYLSVWALAHTVWRRHPYARHDGPASMRAAFTLREARRLAERAGLDAVVEPQPGFRWAMRWRKGGRS